MRKIGRRFSSDRGCGSPSARSTRATPPGDGHVCSSDRTRRRQRRNGFAASRAWTSLVAAAAHAGAGSLDAACAAALGLGYARVDSAHWRWPFRLEPNFRLGSWRSRRAPPARSGGASRGCLRNIRPDAHWRYCEDRQSECKIHLRRVMTRLEIKLLGDLVDANDRSAVVERFASWPRPPLAPWPGASR